MKCGIYFNILLVLVSLPVLPNAQWTATFKNNEIKTNRNLHVRNKRETFDKTRVHRLESITTIAARFSDTEVVSEIENDENEAKEIIFQTQLPKTAFISNFSMTIDGIEYVGEVKEKAKAQKEFQEAKYRGVSAGLVQTQQRETQWFKVSVNVESFASVVFKLRYQQLLERKLGRYEQVVFLDPGWRSVGKFSVKVFINEPTGINSLEALQPYKGAQNNSPQDKNFTLTTRQSETQAAISYFITNFNSAVESGRRFVVRYDVNHANDAGYLWSHNGYIVHFLAPSHLQSIPKRVVFVVDTSGSMAMGNKMQQTKDALKTILPQMKTNDLFNIVTFESKVVKWKDSLRGTSTIDEALNFVRNLKEGGSTNLNDGIITAIRMLHAITDDDEFIGISVVIVLTDGNPSSGETNLENIKSNIRTENVKKHHIFTLGFGSDVNQDFLQQIALENRGLSRKIYAESDAADQLENFFLEVANPLLLNLTLSYTGNVNALTNNQFSSYFGGTEIVVAGMFEYGKDQLNSTIEGIGRKGKFSKTIASTNIDNDFGSPVSAEATIDFDKFFGRLWAYLTVSQLINKEIVEKDPNVVKELHQNILQMSLYYNLVTPLTAMIAQKPPGQDNKVAVISDKKPQDNSFDSGFGGLGHQSMGCGRRRKRRGITKRCAMVESFSDFNVPVIPPYLMSNFSIIDMASSPPLVLGDAPINPDQINAECGFERILKTKSFVKSPGAVYDANTTCKWTINNPSNQSMELIFKSFDLEEDANCEMDRVVVYFDDNLTDYLKHQNFCGYENVTNVRITSYKKFVIVFQSDAQVQGKGFKAVVKTK